jgi:AcrR family transcriptional regulator
MADTVALTKKQEIIAQAYDAFYDGGFHATGIDTVMANSGISKRTLYKYFPSKEDLIEAVLERYGEDTDTFFLKPALARSADPREQIMALFDIRREMVTQASCRGCLAMKAGQEYIGKNEGIAAHGKAASVYIESHFIALCEKVGMANPRETGQQINLLFQGAVLTAQMQQDSSVFEVAKKAAQILLAA